jgi:murein L,D-transpeptidase YcbB/YkuD
MSRFLFLSLLLCVFVAIGGGARAVAQTPDTSVSAALRSQLDDRWLPDSPVHGLSDRVAEVYAADAYRPLWLEFGEPSIQAAIVRGRLADAAAEGLNPSDYHVGELRRLWNAHSPEQLATLDLVLSSGLLSYARDVSSGRYSPKKVDPSWYIEPQKFDAVATLRLVHQSADPARLLDALPPPEDGYDRLRRALRQFRRFALHGGWPVLPEGPKLELGVRSPVVRVLRARLRATEDLSPASSTDEMLLDDRVEQAVRRFQSRHGLAVDGVVGPDTRSAMNVPVGERIRQIGYNMERWRWLPRDLGPRYVLVDTGGFQLRAVENGEQKLAMRVILGRKDRPTPTFSSQITEVVFNPYWTVPTRIAVLDLVPHQRKDPDYLASKHIRVFKGWGQDAAELDPAKVNWSKVSMSNMPYRLRQDPGPQNSLGQIKFMMPNRFDVYLHDTPARSLFERYVRTFSSGCIRLEDAAGLAAYLLGWSPDEVRAERAELQTHSETVSPSVPVYIVYWTAWVEPDGSVQLRDDFYARDQGMARCGEADGRNGEVPCDCAAERG